MTTPGSKETQAPPYEPTSAQLERAASLRRFNWLYVYTTLGIASLAVLVLVGLLLWGALSPNIVGTREFTSGLADIIIILTIMPTLLLCAIVPAAAVGYVIYRRQQPKREYGRLQTLFWRLDSLLDKAHSKTETALPKAAHVIIDGHARVTFWRTLINNLKEQFTRR